MGFIFSQSYRRKHKKNSVENNFMCKLKICLGYFHIFIPHNYMFLYHITKITWGYDIYVDVTVKISDEVVTILQQ